MKLRDFYLQYSDEEACKLKFKAIYLQFYRRMKVRFTFLKRAKIELFSITLYNCYNFFSLLINKHLALYVGSKKTIDLSF
jgi:hypothetical protein